MAALRLLDLFSGYGGFSLAAEAAGGYETIAFCERDPYCRWLLSQHWPDVPCHPDIRELTASAVAGPVDVLTAGFPCQDISQAGKRAGIAGPRSSLVMEAIRLVADLRPAWAVFENVAALRVRGLDVVLGALAEIGYDAVWHLIPAAAVGAPHLRDRTWIIAYPNGSGERRACGGQPGQDPDRPGEAGPGADRLGEAGRIAAAREFDDRLAGELAAIRAEGRWRRPWAGPYALRPPELRRMVDGPAARLDDVLRARHPANRAYKEVMTAIGNGIVPAVAEAILRTIYSLRGGMRL